MWAMAPSTPSTVFTAMMASRYSVAQSASVAGLTRASAFCAAASPRTSQPASSSALTSAGRIVGRRAAIDQQRLGRAADAGAPHLGVEHDAHRHVEVGVAIDVGVADAFEVREHRHARLLLHARDQALAAARHDDVDGCRRGPCSMWPTAARSVRRHELDGGLGQAGRLQAGDEGRHGWRSAELMALRAAAQDRGVAGLEAQRAGVGRHVGAAFVDDADDAERHAHALRMRGRWAASIRPARCRPDRRARRCPRRPWPSPRCAPRRAAGGR